VIVGKPVRFAAILFGLIALLAIPAGIAAAVFIPSVNVLPALVVAVPVAILFGLVGISLARRARFKVERTISRRGARTVRFARFLVWAGLYVGLIGALALGFYGVLRARS
jgi:uncharacterized protein YybS (DUF2232 family)